MRLLCGLLLLLGALSATGYAQSVSLVWDAPAPITPPVQLVGYQLQRCLIPVGQSACVPQDLPGATSAGTTMTDTPPVSGVYQYAVVALCVQCDNPGGRSLPSNAVLVTVGTPPSTAPGGLHADALLPLTPAMLVSVDSVEPGTRYRASNALDGLPTTFWHTAFTTLPMPPHPHRLTLDLGPRTWCTSGARVWPRQDGSPGGMVAQFRLDASQDGQTWTALATSPVLPFQLTPTEVRWPATLLRYVRVVTLSGINAQPIASVAEIHILQGSCP